MERVEGGKEAGPGPNNMDDKNETPIVAHQSSQECSHKQQTDPVSSFSSKDDSNPNAEDSAALDLLSCVSISYEMRQNILGVTYMKDGCTSRSVKWTPIVPSPIAFRTRGRIKNSHNVI